MKITSISVNAGRTLSMPGTNYANVRPQVTFTADLEPGEDAIAAAGQLHEQAEAFLEDRCDQLLAFVAARGQARASKAKREKSAAPASA